MSFEWENILLLKVWCSNFFRETLYYLAILNFSFRIGKTSSRYFRRLRGRSWSRNLHDGTSEANRTQNGKPDPRTRKAAGGESQDCSKSKFNIYSINQLFLHKHFIVIKVKEMLWILEWCYKIRVIKTNSFYIIKSLATFIYIFPNYDNHLLFSND